MKIVISLTDKELNGHKICEALSDPTRVKILRFLISKYPKAQKISEIGKFLDGNFSPTTISFHLRKLREAGLVETNGHKKGFRAVRRNLNIKFNGNGFHIKEEK